MTDRYERIRQALAMGPTPGPWDVSCTTRPAIHFITHAGTTICMMRGITYFGYDQYLANGRFVAACDPDTIRALLEERDALREALKVLVNWTPSADTYRRLGFDPETPMRAHEAAKAALAKGEGK